MTNDEQTTTPTETELFAALAERSFLAVWWTDANGKILGVRGRGVLTAGLSVDEIIGTNVFIDYGPEARRLADIAAAGDYSHGIVAFRDRTFRVSYEKWGDGLIGSSIDVTDWRQLVDLLKESRKTIVEAMVAMFKLASGETERHMRRVGLYSGTIARKLGWQNGEVEDITLAAQLHDAGKLAIPQGILNAPRLLTTEEFNLVKRHSEIGGIELARFTDPITQMASEIAWAHHERWDGEGYPLGLAGEDIPQSARIVTVADFFDALHAWRPYRPRPFALEQIIDKLVDGRGEHFCPMSVDAFLSSLGTILDIEQENPDEVGRA